MQANLIAITATLIAGLATGVGALPILIQKEFSKRTLDVGMGFSAGIMLVASFVSLIIPAIEQGKNFYAPQWSLLIVLIGLFAGYLSIIAIHEHLPHEHLFKEHDTHSQRKLSRVMMIVLAIALHNFPEGLAVGVGFGGGDTSHGLTLAIAIALQNMPEGLVVAFGLVSAGSSRQKALGLAFLSGMVEPVAALIGFLSTQITQFALPISMSFAGGTMLFVICQEIFPELFREGHEKNATLGVITGVACMLVLDNLI